MHSRFARGRQAGRDDARRGANYSTWWNGGLRTTAYFHNMIGLLTETIGNPTPMRDSVRAAAAAADANLPFPIAPQEWHFRQSVDYSVTANYAVLDIASRNRENFLYNIYQMGKNSIERGNRDTWTITPTRAARSRRSDGDRRGRDARRRVRGGGRRPMAAAARRRTAADRRDFKKLLRDPGDRDPRGYILPSDQPTS